MLRTLRSATGLAAILVLFAMASYPAAQAQFGSEKDARAMLDRAVAALKENKEKALEMFNKGEGGSRTAISMCSAPTPQTESSRRIPT